MRYRASGLGTTRFFKCGETFVAFDLATGSESGVGVSPLRTAAPLFKRAPHSFAWGVARPEALDRPAVQRHHWTAETPRDRDLAQRAPTIADCDHAFGGGDDEDVASLAHPRRQ